VCDGRIFPIKNPVSFIFCFSKMMRPRKGMLNSVKVWLHSLNSEEGRAQKSDRPIEKWERVGRWNHIYLSARTLSAPHNNLSVGPHNTERTKRVVLPLSTSSERDLCYSSSTLSAARIEKRARTMASRICNSGMMMTTIMQHLSLCSLVLRGSQKEEQSCVEFVVALN